MIYLKDIRDGEGNSFNASFSRSFAREKGYQTLYIPRHFDTAGPYVLELKSVADLSEYAYAVTERGTSELYYVVRIPLHLDAPAGEYNFRLVSGTTCLSEGILIVTGCDHAPKEFDKQIEYRQYEQEC